MLPINDNDDVSQDALSLAVVHQLVAYDEAKATGNGIATEVPAGDSVRDGLACVDLLHRVWPDFDSPAVGNVNPSPKSLGDFRLIRELGRGGMGTVFEAEQISMGRHVALKVLPFAALVHENSLQRFRNEVRAAAALNHPHIVPVYSIGEERGVHFYAMQLIRGRTLADLIGELRVACKAPSRCLLLEEENSQTATSEQALISTAVDLRRDAESYRAAARLGFQAADALQHAHDQGVLHRDIKPSNLLVEAGGKLYVADFGLARIEADVGMTMTGDIVGTLRYMAPEQALAKRVVIDHRADIYSLGATLYELLTLQPVFGAIDRSQLLKQIAFEEPRPMRKIERRIPIELETIVLKSIAKSPNERYQSAEQLADDLRAYLENRPIAAKPPSLVERAAKWSRRHVAVIWSIAAVLVISTLILGVAGLQVVKSYHVAAERLLQTQKQERIATGVSRLLQQMINTAAPDDEKGATYTVRQMLDDFCATLGEQLSDQPETEATLQTTIGNAYRKLHFPDKAKAHYERALDLRQKNFGSDDSRVADALLDLTLIRFDLAQINEGTRAQIGVGTKCAEEALAIYQRNADPPEQVVHALGTLQRGYQLLGRFAEAETMAARAVATAGDLDTTQIPEIASVIRASSGSYFAEEKYVEAEQLARRAVELHRRLHGSNSQTAWGLVTLGNALQEDEKLDEAESAFREARDIFRQHDEIWSKGVGAADTNLIKLWETTGKCQDEAATLRRELVVAAREIKRLRPEDFHTHMDFAIAVHHYGTGAEFGEAVEASRQAVLLNPSWISQNNLGVLLFENGQIEEAVAVYRKGLAKSRSPTWNSNIAVALYELGHRDEAIDLFRLALQFDSELPPRKPKDFILRLDSTKLRQEIEASSPSSKAVDEPQ